MIAQVQLDFEFLTPSSGNRIDQAAQTDVTYKVIREIQLSEDTVQELPLNKEALSQIERDRTHKRIEQLCKKVSALNKNIGVSWFKAFEGEFSKPYFRRISFFLAKDQKTTGTNPPFHVIYNWTNFSDIRDVKVVIFGRQPYNRPTEGNGLAYSVAKSEACTETLLNIFHELRSDIQDFETPIHGDLSGWAKQGVLLLNLKLTVRTSDKNGHCGLNWEAFTDAVIEWLNSRLTGIVFLFWGREIQLKVKMINRDKHYILIANHPCPQTARLGFFGCKHFSKTNALLIKNGRKPIDWKRL